MHKVKILAVGVFLTIYALKYLSNLLQVEGDHKVVSCFGVTFAYAFCLWLLYLGGFLDCLLK